MHRVIHIQEKHCELCCIGPASGPMHLPVDNQPVLSESSVSSRQDSPSPVRNERKTPSRAHKLGVPKNSAPDVDATDELDRHILYKETVYQLSLYEQASRTGQFLEAAHAFTTYVINARIPHFLRKYPAAGTLKVDGAFLEWKVRELKSEVQRQYVEGKAPGVPMGELGAINHKLNLIAGELAKLSFLYDRK